MENINKILVIAAHPDDEVLGLGGSIAKFADMGKEVHLLIVTDGSSAQYRGSSQLEEIFQKKKKETENCAKILGIRSISYGGLPDMRLDTVPHIEINDVIERVIERVQPDTVFTHFWGDVNVDHQCVYHSTMVAVRPLASQVVKKVYCYSVPSSTEWSPSLTQTMFMPNTFVDISGKYAQLKYDALACYETELREYPHPRSVEHIEKQDNAEGLKMGMETAEKFVLLRSILN